jgi:hypothetical protein
VWERLHLVLLQKLRAAKKLDWSRAVIDSCRTGECAAQPIPRKEL